MSDLLYLLMVNYTAPAADVEAATPDHRLWLDQHYRSGAFLTSGPRQPRTGGVILARGESDEALLALTHDDPFVTRGLAQYEIIAFKPVKRQAEMPLDGVPVVERV